MKFSTLAYLGLASTATCEISCGISSGYDKGEKAYYFSGDGSLANFDACSARCQSDSKCQSFAFDSTQCLLYASALDSNFRQQTNSPFLFYDRNCVNIKATSSFTTTLPATTAPAAGAAATPPASEASSAAGTGGSSGGSGGSGNGGSNGNGGSGGDSSESGSAPTAQAVSTTDGSNTALPGSGGAPGGQLGASKTASSGFSTATATGTGASATGTSSSGSGSGSGSGSSTASSSSSGSSASGSSTSGAAATVAESFRMVVLGSLCVLAVFV